MSVIPLLCLPAAAAAQVRHNYLAPSFSSLAAYDDNIFFRPTDRQGGSFARFQPSLQANWQPSRALTFTGAYSFDAEVYPDYPELNKVFARQRASLGLRYQAGARTALTLNGGYDQTQTAADVIAESGLELGRRPARGYSGGAGLERRLTKGGTGALEYAFRWVEFEGDRARAGHTVTVSWSQQLGASTTAALRAGPRFADDSISADVSASLTGRLRRTTWSVAYTRARYLTPGEATDTEGLAGMLGRQLGRSLQVGIGPGVYRHWYQGAEMRGYRATATALRRLNHWLFAQASYRYVRQQALQRRPLIGDDVWAHRNVFVFGLTAIDPRRGGATPESGP